jgi:alpha-N-arabinofuranosidase
MANLAQMINVLQSVILTEGEKMVKTPTYHVFHMYKEHQNAYLLESHIDTDVVGIGEDVVPNLHESVSVDDNGVINITLNNLSLSNAEEVEVVLTEKEIKEVKASILSGHMDDYNTFEDTEHVAEKDFTEFKVHARGITLVIPACSVLNIRIS